MKAIQICEKNFAAIDLALASVNKDARGHTFSKATELQAIADRFEVKLLKLIGTKKNMPGAKVQCCSGEPVSKSYSYSRIGTQVLLTRGAHAWFLTTASLDQRGGKCEIILTPTQSEIATKHFQRGFLVAETTKGAGQETGFRYDFKRTNAATHKSCNWWPANDRTRAL